MFGAAVQTTSPADSTPMPRWRQLWGDFASHHRPAKAVVTSCAANGMPIATAYRLSPCSREATVGMAVPTATASKATAVITLTEMTRRKRSVARSTYDGPVPAVPPATPPAAPAGSSGRFGAAPFRPAPAGPSWLIRSARARLPRIGSLAGSSMFAPSNRDEGIFPESGVPRTRSVTIAAFAGVGPGGAPRRD